MISASDVKALRERTQAGMLDCRKALEACGGDFDKAVDWLRAKGLAAIEKKAGRVASEGAIGAYVHMGGKIGVLVEVNCETDFVARTDKFKEFVKEISLQICAGSPQWVSIEDIPPSELEHERQIQKARVLEEGKPEAVADRIVEGRLKKFYEDNCLLEQTYFRDESKKIRDLLAEMIQTTGENIKIRRFVKLVLGEGLEKRKDDFAAEVAAQAGT